MEDREIRASSLARACAWTAIAVCPFLAAAALTWGLRSERFDAGIAITTTLLMWMLGWWRFALHPRVVVRAHEIEVRSALRTTTVPMASVERCMPGYDGLKIVQRSGHTVTAWAVQESNASKWLGRRTRADEVADYIQQRAEMSG